MSKKLEGYKKAVEWVKKNGHSSIGLYIFVTNSHRQTSQGTILVGTSGVGTACSKEQRASVIQGPGRGVLKTAEVSNRIMYQKSTISTFNSS